MSDDMNQLSDPATQPVSMHDTPHKHHGVLPLVAAMLGVFLVIESIVLGYVIKEYVLGIENQNQQQTGIREQLEDKIDELKGRLTPFLYAENGVNETGPYSYLKQVNRQTGEETTVLEGEDTGRISLIAVPQINYDGRAFISTTCVDCDNPYLSLSELNVATGQTKEFKLDEGLVYRDAIEVSPDQTKIAYAQYDDAMTSDYSEIRIVDLLTGETEVVGKYADGQYVSEYFGPNAFAGAAGFSLAWKNRECFTVVVYAQPTTPDETSRMSYERTDTFCVGETGPVE